MVHWHLHELGCFFKETCHIVVVTLVTVDQAIVLEVEDVCKSSIDRPEHHWQVFLWDFFGLDN